MSIEKHIKGTPKPQPRPRAFGHGGKARIYNPATANEWKSQIMHGLIDHANTDCKQPYLLYLTFFMPRPKSHYGTGRNKNILKKQSPKYHTKTPDIDNLVKAVMDAVTVINIWHDDSQVVSISATKVWADDPDDIGVKIAMEKLKR